VNGTSSADPSRFAPGLGYYESDSDGSMSESSDSDEEDNPIARGISGIATTSTGVPLPLDSELRSPSGGATGAGGSSRAVGVPAAAAVGGKRARRRRRRPTHVHNASFSVHVAGSAANGGVATNEVTMISGIGNNSNGNGTIHRPGSASLKKSNGAIVNGGNTISRPGSGRQRDRTSTLEDLNDDTGLYDLERERQRKRDSVTGIGHIGLGLAPLNDAAQHTPPELSMLASNVIVGTSSNSSATLSHGHGHTRGSIVSGTSGQGNMMLAGGGDNTFTRTHQLPSASPSNKVVRQQRSHSAIRAL
jgi:hypothetical protein